MNGTGGSAWSQSAHAQPCRHVRPAAQLASDAACCSRAQTCSDSRACWEAPLRHVDCQGTSRVLSLRCAVHQQAPLVTGVREQEQHPAHFVFDTAAQAAAVGCSCQAQQRTRAQLPYAILKSPAARARAGALPRLQAHAAAARLPGRAHQDVRDRDHRAHRAVPGGDAEHAGLRAPRQEHPQPPRGARALSPPCFFPVISMTLALVGPEGGHTWSYSLAAACGCGHLAG
jgi:hypothetical protein